MADTKISVASLGQADFEGFMTKCGGSRKTWHKRWFVLKGDKLHYFKTKKDDVVTGIVILTRESFVRKEPKKKSKNMFAVGTTDRIFYMYPDTAAETDQWVAVLTKTIDKIKNPNQPKPSNQPTNDNQPTPTPKPVDPIKKVNDTPKPQKEDDVRSSLIAAKDLIPYLAPGKDDGGEDGRIFEFWQIWTESIPAQDELEEGAIVFEVSASADLEKLSWKVSGPQHIFIQKMVDFFWNVGAPESEIDRLNDVGGDINPPVIGSWIDMSGKGGMDGGWFFPVETTLELAIKSSDAGTCVTQVQEWASSKGIDVISCVGRDMGAAPPRQTEIKFVVPGSSYEAQLQVALSAYSALGVPEVPTDALNIIKGQCGTGLMMSIVTSSEGMVRLGLLFPHPTKQAVNALCSFSGVSSTTQLINFQNCFKVAGPAFVEFQYLMPGYGYGVYREGFDVVFHYTAGVEEVL